MRKTSRVVAKALAGGAALGLGCLAVVNAAEIVAFFGENTLWVLAGIGAWTATSVVLGLVAGAALRKLDLSQHSVPAPSAVSARERAARPSATVRIPSPTVSHESRIPSPTVPHESEQGVSMFEPTRSRLTTR